MGGPADEIARIQTLLREGLSLSMQGSYQRRMPAAAALPKLRQARRELRALAKTQPTPEVWRGLSLAEEALMCYPAAVDALERAIALSATTDRKDLKRLVQIKEHAAGWLALGLTPEALCDLGAYLDAAMRDAPCDHTHRHTTAWLESRGVKSVAKALRSLKGAGGYCDCEVALNVV